MNQTTAWDGLPQNPERDGWHWLQFRTDRPIATPWMSEIQVWASGAAYSPEGVVELGFHYLGPCLTQADVAEANDAAEANAAWGGRMKQERDALRDAWLRVIQAENSCAVTGSPCDAKRCGCAAEQEMLIREAADAE